jgi:hypothetical protein
MFVLLLVTVDLLVWKKWTEKGGASGRRLEKTHNDKLHNSYSLLNIKVIKSRKMIWVEHVANIEEMRNAHGEVTTSKT